MSTALAGGRRVWGEEEGVGAEQSTRGAPKPEIINQIDNLICVYSEISGKQ